MRRQIAEFKIIVIKHNLSYDSQISGNNMQLVYQNNELFLDMRLPHLMHHLHHPEI